MFNGAGFAGPGFAIGSLGSWSGRGLGPKAAFQFTDLVAEEGGFFELEVVGRGNHFLLEFPDGFRYVEIAAGFLDDMSGLFTV